MLIVCNLYYNDGICFLAVSALISSVHHLHWLASRLCADAGGENFFKLFERKMDEKRDRLKESGKYLLVFIG